jgi:acyl carrier protein
MVEGNDVRDRALKVIFSSFDVHNADRDSSGKLMKAEDTTLFGDEAGLDSFELVRLILSIERDVNEEFGVAITLADEKAMSQRSSPFQSAGTMANYIVQLIEESNRG